MNKLIFTGLKPTGALTLGNYIGVMKDLAKASNDEQILMVANYHAITERVNREELATNTIDLVALHLAAGVTLEKTTIFLQSDIKEHAELGYILACHSYIGELSRMTQYKDKILKTEQNDSVGTGLFIYPTLMAADILLYSATDVPVGSDQKQHVELTRDIAIRFNNHYKENIFKIPQAIIKTVGAKIKSLSQPTKKMSKSDGSDNRGCIFLLDDLTVARKKIMSAVTDNEAKIYYDEINKPGISNLLTILSCLKDESIESICERYFNKGYGDLKKEVADVTVATLEKLQYEYKKIKDEGTVQKILIEGKEKIQPLATKKIEEVKAVLGII